MKTFIEFLEEKYGDSLDEMTGSPNKWSKFRSQIQGATLASGKKAIRIGNIIQSGIDRIPGVNELAASITNAGMPKVPPSKGKLPKPVSTLKINTPQEKQTKTQELMDTIKKMNEFGGSIFDVHDEN